MKVKERAKKLRATKKLVLNLVEKTNLLLVQLREKGNGKKKKEAEKILMEIENIKKDLEKEEKRYSNLNGLFKISLSEIARDSKKLKEFNENLTEKNIAWILVSYIDNYRGITYEFGKTTEILKRLEGRLKEVLRSNGKRERIPYGGKLKLLKRKKP